MRITITIDGELLSKATRLTGFMNRSAMVREGLKALLERESANVSRSLATRSQP